nr:transposase [Corynebacterium macginleyi]
MNQQRQEYTPEYRREAANLVIESHRPIAHVAKEIGVAPGLLGRWVKNEPERRGPPDGLSQADLRAENARLRRELAEAKMDNEFLSKATAFFAAQQREEEKFELM